jgi:hypothetical protein
VQYDPYCVCLLIICLRLGPDDAERWTIAARDYSFR